MKSYEIKNHKAFMNELLMTDSFDMFLLKEAVIKTGNTYTIDGRENKEFYGNDPDIAELESPYDHATWQKMRPVITSFIKGRHTPISMHIILYLHPELKANILMDNDQVTDQLILNVRYSDGTLTLTTGVAYREFTLDKEAERLWDAYADKHFDR